MLTRTGLGVLVGTVVCAFFGLLWRYEELLALGFRGISEMLRFRPRAASEARAAL